LPVTLCTAAAGLPCTRWCVAEAADDEQKSWELTGMASRLSQSWRVAGGLERRMPIAHDELEDDVWRLQGFAILAWDAIRWLTLTPTAEQNHPVAEVHGGGAEPLPGALLPGDVPAAAPVVRHSPVRGEGEFLRQQRTRRGSRPTS